jgi:hypothetical protein
MALADHLARPPAWWGSVLILVLAALVAGIGTTTLPLEAMKHW